MRKQVIFLMTDTTRKDMVGCYGYPKMKTPNLDRLAEEGIRYENAYTCQPVCGPARSAIPKHLDDKNDDFCESLLPWSENLPADCRKKQ